MLRIAIVEDDPMYVGQIQDFLKRFQEEKGKDFKITVFQDGEDIVEHYRCEFDFDGCADAFYGWDDGCGAYS